MSIRSLSSYLLNALFWFTANFPLAKTKLMYLSQVNPRTRGNITPDEINCSITETMRKTKIKISRHSRWSSVWHNKYHAIINRRLRTYKKKPPNRMNVTRPVVTHRPHNPQVNAYNVTYSAFNTYTLNYHKYPRCRLYVCVRTALLPSHFLTVYKTRLGREPAMLYGEHKCSTWIGRGLTILPTF